MEIEVEFEFNEKHAIAFDTWIGSRPQWLKASQNGKKIGRN